MIRESIPEALKIRQKSTGWLVMTVLGLLIIAMFVLSMNTGFIHLSPLELWETLLGHGTAKQELILLQFRLPRIVISVLVGAGLALSGCIMQGISRNALADSGILGINAGAGLVVVLFVSTYSITAEVPKFALPFLALLGGGATAALIYTLSYRRDGGIQPTRLILTGIAVGAGISSAMIVLMLKLSEQNYKLVSLWLAGNISGVTWRDVVSLLPWIVILIPYVFTKSRFLNVLSLGEARAKGLGVSVSREQLKLLAVAVGLAASSVSVSGGIGFVGLIGPHLARRLVGSRHELLLPTSALIGSLLVITADTLGRWVLQPTEIPTGLVVAIIGSPYFLYLLAKAKN
ncbi:FecCD family ABC transporter permease [Paenibacillus segetis]|uniref:Iron ABC transporter permease n=1 Tax=Paenibacillus segetis TaxID=1325360 RepID=A0ABQ1YRS4_9BACL|nr:iron ABC transporter permease [Paenibacillus segetis]GGH36348.1 iron ABC transporter permease [Paenibacillus segetis]